ncbi:MAG: hypothetical protein IJ801_08280, partial [Lachnospiraceae bacterium]|nr:hypothetical protein [Lachnospiraceae bacterium]
RNIKQTRLKVNLKINMLLLAMQREFIPYYGRTKKEGDYMGMTNRQFQGFIRALLKIVKTGLKTDPDNETLIDLEEILQAMLEDGTE